MEKLNASDKLRAKALTWWAENMRNADHVTGVYANSDGGVTFDWEDGKESGRFHVSPEAFWQPRPASGGLEGAVRVVERRLEGHNKKAAELFKKHGADYQHAILFDTLADECECVLRDLRALPDSGEEIIPNDDGRRRLYSIDLQRIIEDLCIGGPIRVPETNARHHYDMAVNYLQALATTPEDKP